MLTGSDVFDHYETLFNGDWTASGGKAPAVLLASRAANLVEAQPADVNVTSDTCPGKLRVSVAIGSLRALRIRTETSFDSLSNTRFVGDFVHTPGSHTLHPDGCTRSSSHTE